MKSIRIKVLISILLVSVSLSSNLSKKSTEKSSLTNLFESYFQAETSKEGGNWENGFYCPKILLAENGGEFIDQGPALIQGKNFVNDGIAENKNGLVLDFYNKVNKGARIVFFAPNISGNKYFIPWRNIIPRFTFTNPFANNKYIQGEILSDKNQTYKLKIVFPFAWTTTYVSDENGNKIRERINKKALDIRSTIKESKDKINIYYPQYKVSDENIIKIDQGVTTIENQIKHASEKIKVDSEKNKQRQITLEKFSKEFDQKNQATQNVLNTIKETNEEIIKLNAEISTGMKSIQTLQNSKKNPQIELEKENKNKNDLLALVNKSYENLKVLAYERTRELDLSKKGFEQLNEKEYQMNINKVHA